MCRCIRQHLNRRRSSPFNAERRCACTVRYLTVIATRIGHQRGIELKLSNPKFITGARSAFRR
jgi:hypothetical protein